ncbi:maleylpyruvate isomerase N-terminal domain-containing protein [Streptomyces fodineus]|uniref:maleylpyruvate isomerase N-terminal domain-containing protein n=1 Tax=Streptomyces fodineus TaxID=1904616 RepID=UPI000A7DAE8B|nr:maleylpyruvate isomerase N-terminal domain-containing protein [Streptomyces fodineus]
MIPSKVDETLPELAPFVHAVQARRPDDGTWCEAWTVRDVLIHQTGNAEELAGVLRAFHAGTPVETKGFERETPYRPMSDAELWAAFLSRCEELTEVAAAAAQDLSPDTEVMWTGRSVTVPFFAEHMREELILHRWDLTGDDRTAVQDLNEPWMTEHSVVSVGRPLLERGRAGLDLGSKGRVEGRLRTPGMDDIVVSADADGGSVRLAAPRAPPRSRATPPYGSCCGGDGAPPTPHAGTVPPDRRHCAGYGPCWAATDGYSPLTVSSTRS